jgi:hypothetical protein
MATIVVDELITKIEYDANDAVLKEAEQAGKALEQQNKALVASADKLSAESTKLAEHTDTLTRSQIDLADQIAESSAKTDRLQSEQRALKEAIEQAGGATGKQYRQLLELDDELAKSQRHTKELREESARLGREKSKVSLESRKLAREQKDVGEAARRTAADQRRLADALRSTESATKSGAGAFGSLTSMIGGIAGGQLAADAVKAIAGAVIDLGKAVITTGANFESLRARLKTVEGSSEGAAMAFSMIQDFAKKTPFEVENITEAFTQLRVRGVNPTTEKLTALGDLSSAFGLQFKDTTDAIGAAARGELDPIEKLGITAKIAGDKISLSFKGQTEMVNRSASAVTDALVKFGQMSGVQGAMAEQSTTAAGMFSNLKDAVSAFFDQIAQMGVLDEVKLLMQSLSDSIGGEGGLARLIADVLIIALKTMRGLFESVPQGPIIEFFQALVGALGLLAEMFLDVIGEQSGFTSAMFEILTPLIEAAVAVAKITRQIEELKEKFDVIPGPLELATMALKLLVIPLEIFSNVIQRVLDFLSPLLTELDGLGERLPSIAGLFNDLVGGVRSLGAEVGLLNNDLEQTAFIADQAVEALRKLAAQNDITKKTDAELQELRRGGGPQAAAADAEIRRRGAEREAVEKQEAAAEKQGAAAKKQGERVDRLLENPGKLTRKQLEAMTNDPKLTEKQRDKAQKELDKRDTKAGKAGQKAAQKQHDSLLTATIAKDIEKLAMEAGQRESARALLGGASEEDANKRELAQRKAVNERLTKQFHETGRLPAGISQDLVQVSNLPNIEQVGGRLAPPVITINNQRIEVTGNTFQAMVDVQGTTATASEIAAAAIAQARPVLWEDLGRAIGNYTTTLRRG